MRTLAFLTAAAAIGAAAAPAAAQYYPQPQTYPYPQQVPQPYPGQPGYGYPQPGYPQGTYPQGGYGYPQQGGIGGILGQLLGNRYQGNDRTAISQCVNAATIEASRQTQDYYRQRAQQGYGQPYGYNQAYAGQARVVAISNVERRKRNTLRVTGLIDSGMNVYAQQPYGNAYGYNRNQAYAQGDMRFNCTVDYTGRVTNLRLSRAR